jgi:hypothetical protein
MSEQANLREIENRLRSAEITREKQDFGEDIHYERYLAGQPPFLSAWEVYLEPAVILYGAAEPPEAKKTYALIKSIYNERFQAKNRAVLNKIEKLNLAYKQKLLKLEQQIKE